LPPFFVPNGTKNGGNQKRAFCNKVLEVMQQGLRGDFRADTPTKTTFDRAARSHGESSSAPSKQALRFYAFEGPCLEIYSGWWWTQTAP
jgi:hypothetical protein